MSTEIDVINEQPLQAAVDPGGVPPGGAAQRNPLLRLLTSARRHWLLVLMVWILVGVPAFAAIWMLIKPTYTASAFIEVAPAVQSILYPDERSQIAGGFDAFLNTQAQMVTSSRIITAALADPNVKGLPVLDEPDPVAALRENLSASTIKNTHLIRVSVEQDEPDAAKRLATAVMRVYGDYAQDNERNEAEKRREILESTRSRLKADLTTAIKDVQDAAATDGTSSRTTFEIFREANIELTTATQRDLDQAIAEEAALIARQKALNEGHAPTTMPAEDVVWKEQEIERDPMIRSIREELAAVSMRLIRSGQTEHYRQKQEELQETLDKELARAAADADRRLRERHESLINDQKGRIDGQIAAAQDRVKALRLRLDELKEEGMKIGRRGLAIEDAQKKAEIIERDFQLVDDELRKMEIEQGRPTRITVDTSAEILPDGIKDKRKKLAPVALVGSLGLGLMLALLIDLIRGRVHSVDDVELGVGLPLLGSLPSIRDLQRGRVSEQDFRESYRLIRATLAGVSPGGAIPRTLLVTSPQASEGKTSFAISLAASLAETGARVLLIDGDVQAPRVAQTLKLAPPFGLRQVLMGECALEDSVGATPVKGLDVLLAGRNGSSAGGLLTADLAAGLLKSARKSYDHVIIDSPPALGAADATIWAQSADGVILSSLAGHSSQKLIRHTCTRLASAGGRILGGVLCNISFRENRYSYSSASLRSSSEDPANSTDPASAPALDSRPFVHLPYSADLQPSTERPVGASEC